MSAVLAVLAGAAWACDEGPPPVSATAGQTLRPPGDLILLGPTPAVPAPQDVVPDSKIAWDVRATLRGHELSTVDVRVDEQVVTLSGPPEAAERARAAIQNIAGIRQIRLRAEAP